MDVDIFSSANLQSLIHGGCDGGGGVGGSGDTSDAPSAFAGSALAIVLI